MSLSVAPLRIMLAVFSATVYLLLYWSTWTDMERVWSSSATYNHCYLIIPIALYLFYRSKQPPQLSETPSARWLIVPAMTVVLMQALWLLGFAADLALLMHAAAVITLQALLWLLLGNSNSYRHRFAIFYLIFLIPFGEELSPFLQNITADHTVMLLQAVNIPVFREGLFLATPVGMLEVAEACSGLRFLIAALAISVLFAYLHYNSMWKQLVFVIVMAFLSVLANGVRAFMLVYIGEKSGMKYGFGADHFVYGWLFFGLVLMAGFWVGARFADPFQPMQRSASKYFSLQPANMYLYSTVLALILTLGFHHTLHVAAIPQQQVQISDETADWGIRFVDALIIRQRQDTNGISYYFAQYANKQQRGELINWQNNLFDKQLWQVQTRIETPQHTILQLKNLSGGYRTVMYWYQVGDYRAAGGLKTKLLQAIAYLTDDHSMSCIIAVSTTGAATEQNIDQLNLAVGAMTPCNNTVVPANAGVLHD